MGLRSREPAALALAEPRETGHWTVNSPDNLTSPVNLRSPSEV